MLQSSAHPAKADSPPAGALTSEGSECGPIKARIAGAAAMPA